MLREVIGDYKHYQITGFVIIFLLSLLTSVSWTSSHLMPDIFTAIMILAAILILTATTTKKEQLFLYLVFIISTAMHMSHISFNIAFFMGILLLRKIGVLKLKSQIKVRPVLVMITLTLASIITMGSALSKSKHVFFMGALVEHGIAK